MIGVGLGSLAEQPFREDKTRARNQNRKLAHTSDVTMTLLLLSKN